MLSYRHSYHAGNFADVLKHLVLVRCLRHLLQKDKPLLYLDTHAGAGAYPFGSPQPGKTPEYQNGIAKLWNSDHPGLADYLSLVRGFNASPVLQRYPGSPWFAQRLLRASDRLALHELHSSDFRLLRDMMKNDPRARLAQSDGYQACRALLPPPQRRGLILMDPSYENKQDYQQVVETLRQAQRRFATGVYALWYPVVERSKVQRLEKAMRNSGLRNLLLLELAIAPDTPGYGMTASGMLLLNPPWPMATEMPPVLEYLAQQLGQGRGGFRVEQLVGE